MNPNIYNDVRETARIAIQNGHTITIDKNLPSVFVSANFDDEYYFEGHEAEELLASTEKSLLREFCSVEQIILWKAQSW